MRRTGGIVLIVLSLLMLLGFFRSTASLASPSTVVALLLIVGIPAVAGVALVRGRAGSVARGDRREALRRQTVEAEILRLAGARGGRLTLVEIGQELAITTEHAQEALDALLLREVADVAVAETGTLVYTFRDLEPRLDKGGARNVLE